MEGASAEEISSDVVGLLVSVTEAVIGSSKTTMLLVVVVEARETFRQRIVLVEILSRV